MDQPMAMTAIKRQTGQTEIISVASGKGGTGKTVILAALGYALQRSGLKVLFVDTDIFTDGLSLFLLGPKGHTKGQIDAPEFKPENTFAGYLKSFQDGAHSSCVPRSVSRLSKDDHGQTHCAIVSSRGLYGDTESEFGEIAPNVPPDVYCKALQALFRQEWDYILVDTRGGFSPSTADACALSDSFFLVTEPNPSSFYQDRSLFDRISRAAVNQRRKANLRGVFVNKSDEVASAARDTDRLDPMESAQVQALDLEKMELQFRQLVSAVFSVDYAKTYPIPARYRGRGCLQEPDGALHRTRRFGLLLCGDVGLFAADAHTRHRAMAGTGPARMELPWLTKSRRPSGERNEARLEKVEAPAGNPR